MIIDTHTHVPRLDGVDKIILVSAAPEDVDGVPAAAKNDPNIFRTVGIHPQYFDAVPDYAHLLSDPKVVAVGEIGLDYHYDPEHKIQQIELFRRQLEIAREANLPVAVHSREADDDLVDILKDGRGVLHSFTGGYECAKTMIGRGFFISANGILTFKNAQDLRDMFTKIPVESIIAETDAPYCAPVPYRGKPASSAMIVETIKCLSEIKKIPLVEMENILWDNARKCFDRL